MRKISPTQFAEWFSLPLEKKIELSKERIRSWYTAWDGKVFVSFSGGKDSTVLLHLVRSVYPDVRGVFVNTGLEYPEIVEFVKKTDNITHMHPAKPFKKVITEHGYPMVSKDVASMIDLFQNPTEHNQATRRFHDTGVSSKGRFVVSRKIPARWRYLINEDVKISDKCCLYLKKYPIKKYQKETGEMPFIGTMAKDSKNRMVGYLNYGCNAFDTANPRSVPIAFWSVDDIWAYIRQHSIPYSNIYDKGYDRTGCMFCMFGIQYEQDGNRFLRMKETHPKHWDVCINKLGVGKCLDLLGVDYGVEDRTGRRIYHPYFGFEEGEGE